MMKISQEKWALLERYVDFLIKWNGIHNLSGKSDKEALLREVEDSILPIEMSELGEILKGKTLLLDIGSGNGFPAIPLGIMLEIPVILCEPNNKKAAFLQNCKVELDLKNFSIKKARVEDLHLVKKPDFITSRAVMNVEMLLKFTKNLITKQTFILLYKGSNVLSEIPKGLEYKIYHKNLRNYLTIKGESL